MEKKYVHQIVKRLKCSKKKREEIKRQLESEIDSCAESGESAEEIISRMGSPAEIAAEFNQSFPDIEQRKGRREKWSRRLIIITAVIVLLALLIYWALPKTTPIEKSTVFDRQKVQEQAEQVIQFLDKDNYDALQKLSIEKLQPLMTKEAMAQAKETFGSEWGEFQFFGNVYLADVKQRGKHTAIIQLNASYEQASITYTLVFDKDMKLSGFWMK